MFAEREQVLTLQSCDGQSFQASLAAGLLCGTVQQCLEGAQFCSAQRILFYIIIYMHELKVFWLADFAECSATSVIPLPAVDAESLQRVLDFCDAKACELRFDKVEGWMDRNRLWGVYPNETF